MADYKPTHVYIGSMKVPIVFSEEGFEDDERGSFDNDKIKILKSQNEYQMKVTIFHEIIHAFFFYYGHTFASEEEEENFVKKVEPVFQVLVDKKNSKLVKDMFNIKEEDE